MYIDRDNGMKLNTDIYKFADIDNNHFFIKRDDLIPFSFGGNKVRKALLFFEDIDAGEYDCVVTYGSSHSNHCRVIANLCVNRNIKCHIISPLETSDQTYNQIMMQIFGAKITCVPVASVSTTIERLLDEYKKKGSMPYFIPGGGHGNIGTQAYVNCYTEIRNYEEKNKMMFDYIFFPSGTGTTQAGLVCGKIIKGGIEQIIGVSIARKNPYGREVIYKSVYDYLNENSYRYIDKTIDENIIFDDASIGYGYGVSDKCILNTIKTVMCEYGIPLDSTYTGKAYCGMLDYIGRNQVKGKNILFIHTGGTPLFFDDLAAL